MSRERRERIEAAVDGLLHLLDELDGDADLEPSTNAHNGWTDGYSKPIASGDLDDCEDNHDAEPDMDGEPSLGWTDMEARCSRYASDSTSDREGPDPDLEDNGDSEPSLGYIPPPGSPIDAEGPDDNGIADEDGMYEQDFGQSLGGEPSLGWTLAIHQDGPKWHGTPGPWQYAEDGEQEHDGREPDEDREPSLGALENHPGRNPDCGSQERWGNSSTSDREDDGDDREPELGI